MRAKIQAACLTLFLCVFVWCLSPFPAALAQPVPSSGLDQGLTSFYDNRAAQKSKIEVLSNLGASIAVPFVKDSLPANFASLSDSELIEQLKSIPIDDLITALGDGAFQQGVFDFEQAQAVIPGTDTSFTVTGELAADNGSLTVGKLYSVVAGKPNLSACPVSIEDTQIAFFDEASEADAKAAELAHEGYLVYVTGNRAVQKAAVKKLLDLGCVFVNGVTKKVTVDFRDIFYLLPSRTSSLQQITREYPLVYLPKTDSIYLVNSRKLYGADQ